MAGNSKRRGAVRRSRKGNPTAGSGGRVRRGLEGKGPTPKATDRPAHKAHRSARPEDARAGGRTRRPARRTTAGANAEWVAGRNAVVEALRAGVPVQTLYVADRVERDDRVREVLDFAAGHGTSVLEVSRAELDRLTGDAAHQGLAARVPAYDYAHPDDLVVAAAEAGRPAMVVALDGVTDPRNLGAVIRSAAAFGAHGVVVPERRSAGVTAAAWKASAGAAARLPVARATNLARQLGAYRDAGLVVAGLAADGADEVGDYAADIAGEPLVLVVGGEGAGMSRLVRAACDTTLSVPMASAVESLNAGVAAGIALYELARARSPG